MSSLFYTLGIKISGFLQQQNICTKVTADGFGTQTACQGGTGSPSLWIRRGGLGKGREGPGRLEALASPSAIPGQQSLAGSPRASGG